MNENVSRRSFLAGGAAVGAAALTGMGGQVVLADEPAAEAEAAPASSGMTADALYGKWDFEIAPEGISDDQIAETFEAEVVVVGAGTGGLTAACSAVEAGLDVILISASSKPISRGGSNHAVYSKAKERLGIPKDDPVVYEKEMRGNGSAVDARKWYRFYNNSEEAMNWLIDIMEAEGYITGIEAPASVPEDTACYYAIGAHGWFLPEEPGMGMNQPFVVNTLAARFEQLSGRGIFYKNIAKQLVRGGVANGASGRVEAVIALREDGTYAKYVGTKAIVLATGDFSANKDMVAKYCTPYMRWIDPAIFVPESERDYDKEFVYGGVFYGDGQQMGLWVGAAWQKNMTCGVNGGGAKAGMLPWGGGTLFPGISVGLDGRRFANEYVTLGAGPMTYFTSAPQGMIFTLFDAGFPKKYPYPLVNGQAEYGSADMNMTPEQVVAGWDSLVGIMYTKCDTLEELIEELGLPMEQTLETVKHYNEMCAAGEDTEFYKDPSLMIPLEEGPFYGAKGNSNFFLCTLGGLRTNEWMQVCDENDEPIPGLYNNGCMVGDMFSAAYSGAIPGFTYGSSITFGYLMGKYIAENE